MQPLKRIKCATHSPSSEKFAQTGLDFSHDQPRYPVTIAHNADVIRLTI